MSFTQLIELDNVDDEAGLRKHIADWDQRDAEQAPGYLGARILRDLDVPGRYVLAVDFSSHEDAKRNNDRPETSRWAQGLQNLGTPTYVNLGGVYRTGA